MHETLHLPPLSFPSHPSPFPPFPSSPFPLPTLPLRPLRPLRSRFFKFKLKGLGSVVSSPSGRGAPAKIEFDAFSSLKI